MRFFFCKSDDHGVQVILFYFTAKSLSSIMDSYLCLWSHRISRFCHCKHHIFMFIRSKDLFSIQEYPPGVVLVPMGSRTGKPFRTTNLVVFSPKNVSNDCGKNGFIACGDALIVDPGCHSEFHEEVWHVSLLCCA